MVHYLQQFRLLSTLLLHRRRSRLRGLRITLGGGRSKPKFLETVTDYDETIAKDTSVDLKETPLAMAELGVHLGRVFAVLTAMLAVGVHFDHDFLLTCWLMRFLKP